MIAEAMAGLEAMAMRHRGRFVFDSALAKSNRQFFGFLCFSVLLHGLILALPAAFGNRASSDFKTLPIQARIRVQDLQPASNEWPTSTRTERRFASTSLREPHATILRPTQQQPLKNNVTTRPESDTSPISSLNMEDLREQARTLAKEPPNQLVRGTNTNRHAPEKAAPDLADRPILAALSKHLGKTLQVMSEQVMNDGSRFIRFSGNRCLHIPPHLPFGTANEVTPTILLPTNCPK